MPSLTRTKLMRAEARSDAARDRLLCTIDEIKARLHPSAIAAAAQDELRATAEALVCKGADAARRRPARVVGAVSLVLGLALAAPFTRRKRRRKPESPERV
ncbi:uncharacterized protein DUF3618 [Hephaestia caeni]|uniref:Uncharacterized protein DUF3618 n=1 Tax=Hephaestia caeni TaxID=645617 RepID=A0A397NTE8_9SPHN|nr:DUF3618 domain-containing protein [Hephaestia caeni]RIA36691.1 uncharacterized protein DUF3618 [Hephaestia caeni]